MKTLPFFTLVLSGALFGCANNEPIKLNSSIKDDVGEAMRSVAFRSPYPDRLDYIEISKKIEDVSGEYSMEATHSGSDSLVWVSQKVLYGTFDNRAGQSNYSVAVRIEGTERYGINSAQIKTPYASYSTLVDQLPQQTECSSSNEGKPVCRYSSIVQFQVSVFPYLPEEFSEIKQDFLEVDLISIGRPALPLRLNISNFKQIALANRGYLERVVLAPAIQD